MKLSGHFWERAPAYNQSLRNTWTDLRHVKEVGTAVAMRLLLIDAVTTNDFWL